MAFTPIPTLGRIINCDPLRYRIRTEKGRARLHIAASREMLAQVKGEPQFWRLEIDAKAKRGRLTGLVQNDGQKATRKQTGDNAVSASFTWSPTKESSELFPDTGKVESLKNHSVTSIGIEFDLP